MVVLTAKREDEIPKDAIRMSRTEAVNHQMKIVHEWPDLSEVWPLRFSSTILGVTSILSSYYVNTHFRTKLKLSNYNRMSSYIPTVCLPAIMTTLFHTNNVTTSVVVSDTKDCPVCIQTRAMAIQVGFGCLYPCILGPISAFFLATRNYTFRLPTLTENPLEVLKLARKMFRPIQGPIVGFAILNAMMAAFLTYKEFEAIFTVREKIIKFEESELEFE